MAIFDRQLQKQRQLNVSSRENFVIELVVADLHDRLSAITRAFNSALIIGPSTYGLPAKSASALGEISFHSISSLEFDEAAILRGVEGQEFDLIVSILDMQTINDVEGYLANIRKNLSADGLFMAAFIGGNSLNELRQSWLHADTEVSGGAAPRVIPMIDIRDGGKLLQSTGYALPVTDVELYTIRYDNPLKLFDEIKSFGASNLLLIRGGGLVTPHKLMSAAQYYAENYADADGRVRATLEIIWLSGWAPHESQQKPLKPGSATISLADALKAFPLK